jgi:hypothetical protein
MGSRVLVSGTSVSNGSADEAALGIFAVMFDANLSTFPDVASTEPIRSSHLVCGSIGSGWLGYTVIRSRCECRRPTYPPRAKPARECTNYREKRENIELDWLAGSVL